MERPEEINARVARFGVTRHARDLWPDVSVRAFRAAEVELARIATAVLSGTTGPVAVRPDLGPRALGVAAFAGGVGPLVGYWCETGHVAADPAVARLFAMHLEHGRRRAARLRGELDRVIGAMAARGIEVWVLKGMHTAYRYFPDPGTRCYADIDLLVHPDSWVTACQVLAGLGLVEHRHPSQPRDSAWAPPGDRQLHTLDYVHADGPWSVDLHSSLDRVPFEGLETRLGSPDAAAGEVWQEFSHPVRILAQPQLLAYLAVHASSHFYAMMLGRLVELVLVARRDLGAGGGAAGWTELRELAQRTGAGRFMFPALDLAERLVPGSIDETVLRQVAAAAPRRLRRLVRAMAPATAQRLHPFPGLRERFVWVASFSEALAALVWLIRPHHGDTQWARVRRAWRRIFHASLTR